MFIVLHIPSSNITLEHECNVYHCAVVSDAHKHYIFYLVVSSLRNLGYPIFTSVVEFKFKSYRLFITKTAQLELSLEIFTLGLPGKIEGTNLGIFPLVTKCHQFP